MKAMLILLSAIFLFPQVSICDSFDARNQEVFEYWLKQTAAGRLDLHQPVGNYSPRTRELSRNFWKMNKDFKASDEISFNSLIYLYHRKEPIDTWKFDSNLISEALKRKEKIVNSFGKINEFDERKFIVNRFEAFNLSGWSFCRYLDFIQGMLVEMMTSSKDDRFQSEVSELLNKEFEEYGTIRSIAKKAAKDYLMKLFPKK